ncbi:MAG: DNA polymerase/3'-5' exonuclease PolX [Candidatus Doudnabacteria bacterium]|nr:DNA polymerase/3'-5' exonuclease PolX [Candidatus Doudnabacteria bacterium]
MTNQEIAKILYAMADYYEMFDVAFKPRAYQKAALAVESLDKPVLDIYREQGFGGFLKIPGVGRGIAEHLEELLKSGRLKIYEKFRKKIPVDLEELTAVEGVGPKTVKVLYEKLKIRTLKDLQKAVQARKLRNLSGFGQRSEERILEGLQFATAQGKRYVLGFVEPIVENLVGRLKSSGFFDRLEVGGSYRRRQETVGDIDILGIAENPKAAMDYFVHLPDATHIIAHGEDKSEIKLENGIQVDLRLIRKESWGAALQYFTGNKAHNIKLRKIAIEKGYKLSEYGLTPHSPPSRGGKKRGVIVDNEEKIYQALGLDYIPPELRNDIGEIEAARKHELPRLINYGDVRGDLQVQTDWTDGTAGIEQMAEAARRLGREYIAITDHTKFLAMTGGLDEKKLLKQMAEIDKLNAKAPSFPKRGKGEFRILKGAEVNILKDGSLDIKDEVLAKLDIVGVSVHSNFKMSRADMTKRIVRALSNPNVDIFFHPTTRIINRRAPIDFDFDEILKVCRKNKVALEIDAYPDRMDIHDTLIRKAVGAGVKLVIDTDAHNPAHLNFIYLGEAQARRGWATKNDVLNTRSWRELLKYFPK